MKEEKLITTVRKGYESEKGWLCVKDLGNPTSLLARNPRQNCRPSSFLDFDFEFSFQSLFLVPYLLAHWQSFVSAILLPTEQSVMNT